jgi:hypothetical protein
VAFARLSGAVLLLAGSLLVVGSASRPSEKAFYHAVFWSAAFGSFIGWAQQQAIWLGTGGWLFFAAFLSLSAISGIWLLRARYRDLRASVA